MAATTGYHSAMRLIALAACCVLSACAGASTTAPPSTTPSTSSPGLRTTTSTHNFADTVARLEAAITSKGLRVFTKIDHAANAKAAGLELPATTLIIFGKPQVGTQLMTTSRSVAVDLPQKFLVWQDGTTVSVTYNDPKYLQLRHGLDAKAGLLDKVAGLLKALATAATR